VTVGVATTVHVLGRCRVKGCRYVKRHSFGAQIITDRYGTHTNWSIPTAAGAQHAYCTWAPARLRLTDLRSATDVAWAEAMLSLGWVCPEHDAFVEPRAIRGVVNVDKSCNARCMGAAGPSCECACGGEMHGSRWT